MQNSKIFNFVNFLVLTSLTLSVQHRQKWINHSVQLGVQQGCSIVYSPIKVLKELVHYLHTKWFCHFKPKGSIICQWTVRISLILVAFLYKIIGSNPSLDTVLTG